MIEPRVTGGSNQEYGFVAISTDGSMSFMARCELAHEPPLRHLCKSASHKGLDMSKRVGYTINDLMTNVTKKDIVEEIARRTGMTQAETKSVLEGLLDAISTTLRDGRNIEIRGFGRFKVRPRKARLARNPRTGELVQVEGGVKPVFEASRELKALLNAGDLQIAQLQQALQQSNVAEISSTESAS